jgi:hypothetical protein
LQKGARQFDALCVGLVYRNALAALLLVYRNAFAALLQVYRNALAALLQCEGGAP